MPMSTTRPSVADVRSKISDTTRNETTAPAPRPMTSMELPTCAMSEAPIETTSPVGTLRGSVAPSRTMWRPTICTVR